MRNVSAVIAAMRVESDRRPQPLRELARVALHHSRVLGDALAVEGRLDDTAHLTMERVFAREQALAEQQPQHARAERL